MQAFFELNLVLILTVLTIAMVVSSIRLFLGPSLADRVVALDLVTVAGVGAMAAAAVAFADPSFLDISVLLGLIGFVGTAAFASYIERAHRHE